MYLIKTNKQYSYSQHAACNLSVYMLPISFFCRSAFKTVTVASHERHSFSNYLQLDCLFNRLFPIAGPVKRNAFPRYDVITSICPRPLYDRTTYSFITIRWQTHQYDHSINQRVARRSPEGSFNRFYDLTLAKSRSCKICKPIDVKFDTRLGSAATPAVCNLNFHAVARFGGFVTVRQFFIVLYCE